MAKNTMLKSDAAMMLLAEKDAHQRTLDALANLRKELREHFKLDVRKHYSLMVADAAAGTIIYKANAV